MSPPQIDQPQHLSQPGRDSVPEHEVVLTETEARAAVPLGRMRYVLGISLSLSIVALIVVYFAYG